MSLFPSIDEEKPIVLIEPEVIVLPKKPRKEKPTLGEQFEDIPTKHVIAYTLPIEDKKVLSAVRI